MLPAPPTAVKSFDPSAYDGQLALEQQVEHDVDEQREDDERRQSHLGPDRQPSHGGRRRLVVRATVRGERDGLEAAGGAQSLAGLLDYLSKLLFKKIDVVLPLEAERETDVVDLGHVAAAAVGRRERQLKAVEELLAREVNLEVDELQRAALPLAAQREVSLRREHRLVEEGDERELHVLYLARVITQLQRALFELSQQVVGQRTDVG